MAVGIRLHDRTEELAAAEQRPEVGAVALDRGQVDPRDPFAELGLLRELPGGISSESVRLAMQSLCRELGCTLDEDVIVAVNGLSETAGLKAGQRLLIPVPVKPPSGDPAFTPAPLGS